MISWFLIGTLHLLILTYQDYKNKMLVDDRHNWLMFGLTIALFSFFSHPFWYIGVIFAVILIVRYLFKKFKVMGAADINSFIWMFSGFTIMGIDKLILFCVVFSFCRLVHFALMRLLFRKNQNVQGYPVFLISFLVMCFFILV